MSDHRDDADERIGAAIRAVSAGVDAPDELHARIARDRAASAHRHRRRYGLRVLIAAAGALTALVLAIVIALPSDTSEALSVAEAAAAGLSAPNEVAPAVDPRDPRFVSASAAGIRFPNYAYDSSWRTEGQRQDVLHGRRARTVSYARGAVRVGYTIVDGPPLTGRAGARAVDAAGTRAWVARRDGVLVVSWERGGHTCVLASRAATLPQMLRFVTWRDVA